MMSSISIIIPVYKGEQYIEGLTRIFSSAIEELHSVYPDVVVQMVFINDHPKTSIQGRYFKLPELTSCEFLNPGIHQGIHGTRVYGLKHTDSDYVLFFDQDDLIEERYLLSQYEKINAGGILYDGAVCNGIYRENRLIYSDSRPMEMTFDRSSLLEKQWNPLSPGQVLIRRKAIPIELWSKHILTHNLTDDWLLWFLMVHQGCRFNLNEEVLYTHCEDGSNSSLHWKEMGQSRVELLYVLRELKVLTEDEDSRFLERTENYLKKYEKYIQLDGLLEKADHERLKERIHEISGGRKVAIYGMGVYGKELFRLLVEAGVDIPFCMDQHAGAIQDSEVPIYKDCGRLVSEPDMIVVTPLFAFDEIVSSSLADFTCPKIRMDDYIRNCLDA